MIIWRCVEAQLRCSRADPGFLKGGVLVIIVEHNIYFWVESHLLKFHERVQETVYAQIARGGVLWPPGPPLDLPMLFADFMFLINCPHQKFDLWNLTISHYFLVHMRSSGFLHYLAWPASWLFSSAASSTPSWSKLWKDEYRPRPSYECCWKWVLFLGVGS